MTADMLPVRPGPSDTGALGTVRDYYAIGATDHLFGVRDLFPGRTATSPHARAAGWERVMRQLQWSITWDCVHSRGPSAAELELWLRIEKRRAAISNRLHGAAL